MDLDKEDFSEDLQNLFKDPQIGFSETTASSSKGMTVPSFSETALPTSIVRQKRTFQNVTSDYIIDNIKENNILLLL